MQQWSAGLLPAPLNADPGAKALENVVNDTAATVDALRIFNIARYGSDRMAYGLADATAAFGLALADAAATPGGVVLIPPGSFHVSATIHLPSNVTVYGLGAQSRVVPTGMAGLIVFAGSSVTNVTVTRFAIAGTCAEAVAFGASTNIEISKMTISGATTVLPSTGYGAGIHVHECSDVTIDDNVLSGNGFRSDIYLTSDILCNGLTPYGFPRHHIRRNRCSSTDVHTNISGYNLQDSEISGNEVTGAYTRAGDNTGYGILLYAAGFLTAWDVAHTYAPGDFAFLGAENYVCIAGNVGNSPPTSPAFWTVLDHPVRDNRVLNNYVRDVGGSGIYTANGRRTLIHGNLIERNSQTQTEVSLPSAGIAINGGVASVLNNRILNVGRSGISFVLNEPGSIAKSNTILSAAGLCGIRLQGDATGIGISGNDIQGCVTGIGSTDATWNMVALSLADNHIADCTGQGVFLSKAVACQVTGGSVLRSGGHGIWLASTGTSNTVSGVVVLDSGQTTPGTYGNIFIQTTQTAVTGNVTGNTMANGAIYGVTVDPAGVTGTAVTGNVGKDNRTADFNLPIGVSGGGNVSTGNGGTFTMGQFAMLARQGGALIAQLALGDSSTAGAVGITVSQGDTYIATNAQQTTALGNWHQMNAALPSLLFQMRHAGGWECYTAAAGTADGTLAAFWGAAKAAITSAGGISVSSGTLITSTAAFTNGAAAAAGTLGNAPVAGNPTKWIPISDNGTTRYIPTW